MRLVPHKQRQSKNRANVNSLYATQLHYCLIVFTVPDSVNLLRYFVFQDCCNQLQRARLLGSGSHSTLAAIATDLEASHDDMEAAVPLDLPLEPVEKIALELRDLATT